MAAEVTKRVQGGSCLVSRSPQTSHVGLIRRQGKPEQKRLDVLLGDVVKTDLPVRGPLSVLVDLSRRPSLDPSRDSWTREKMLTIERFQYFDVCISNTPYQVRLPLSKKAVTLTISQISSPLTFKLLALSPAPRTCILTFQHEFAQRLFARAGSTLYSRLSVNTQMWATVTHIMKIVCVALIDNATRIGLCLHR